jgi:hypothetical protein
VHDSRSAETTPVVDAPKSGSVGVGAEAERILALQQTIGNAAISRLVGAPGRPLARVPARRAAYLTLARTVHPDSPEYIRGYNEGRGNMEQNATPLAGDALESYEEGYRRGKAEAEAAGSSSLPVDKPAPATPALEVIEFTNPDLQQVYDANKPGTTGRLDAMRALDRDVKGVWSQLTWAQLVKSAAQRIYNPNMMAQGSLGTCGPATILNFLGTNDPLAYANLVVEVFRNGEGNGKSINKTLRGSAPQPGMDALDWMLMSAVQDITNDWYEFYGTKEGAQAKREGTGSSDQRWAYKHFAGVTKAETIDTPEHGDVLPAARRVSGLVTKPGVSVNMHLSAAVLQNPSSGPNARNHVIRLLKPITITEDADDAKSSVTFVAFTWGRVFTWKGTVNQFIHMIWAFTIAATSGDAF